MSTRSAVRPERQARSLLRAFPWRVAAERGDEIVAAPAAPLLIGTGLAAMALGTAAISVVGHPHPVTVRASELALGTAMAPADPLDAAGPWIVGAVAAALLAALALAASVWIRRGRPVPEPVRPPLVRIASRSRRQALVALGGLAAVTVLALLWLVWWPWNVAVVLAAAGGVGAVAFVGGIVLEMVGRRRQRPIGLWEVLPRVGPREAEVPLPAWWLASHPDPRWVVVGPAIPA